MPAFKSIAAIAALSLLPQIFAQDTTVVDPSIDNSTSSDTTVSSSQYWHERYHGLLSMAAYDPDFETKCMEQTFTQAALMKSFPDSTEAPWTLIERFGPTQSGASGFNVIIPEMDKIVTVFKGMFGWESTFNDSSADIGEALFIGERCSNATGGPCLAHAGALQAYLEVKELTNSFALAESYVTATGHQWSVTGHGFGGMLAQIASLDLGWRNKLHWSHSHGSPRVFNPAAADLYNQLFQGEAGQRTVANEDAVVEYIPESANYTHVLQGFHIYGENATYGMSFDVCNEVNDPNCLGGSNVTDHLFYYTPIGECGSPNKANYTQQDIYESTASEAFYATATSTFVAPTSTPEPTSTSMDSSMSQAMASSASAAAASGNPGGQNAASNTNGASTLKTGLAGLVVTAFGFVLLA